MVDNEKNMYVLIIDKLAIVQPMNKGMFSVMDDPWVPVNPMGMVWAKFYTCYRYGFLMDLNNFRGNDFGMAKSAGFVLGAIPNHPVVMQGHIW